MAAAIAMATAASAIMLLLPPPPTPLVRGYDWRLRRAAEVVSAVSSASRASRLSDCFTTINVGLYIMDVFLRNAIDVLSCSIMDVF